ncbi:MAG TPA: methylated-DNA--[protein]-cysteine S-methyltransferase [Candidatus Cybelea sp.]|nr:methylated-DNA--[protein]-cysteine S-methyltransferase [Candidatus Cybelea sp.]
MPQLTLHSPVGELTVTEEDGAIVSVDWGRGPKSQQGDTPLLREAKRQLDLYFDGKLKEFDLPLRPAGADFEQQVWQEMLRIPYGETRSYGEVATAVGNAARAVGGACGANPIPIIIPCHRILAAQGKIGGYSGRGGVETKVALLRLEGASLL